MCITRYFPNVSFKSNALEGSAQNQMLIVGLYLTHVLVILTSEESRQNVCNACDTILQVFQLSLY